MTLAKDVRSPTEPTYEIDQNWLVLVENVQAVYKDFIVDVLHEQLSINTELGAYGEARFDVTRIVVSRETPRLLLTHMHKSPMMRELAAAYAKDLNNDISIEAKNPNLLQCVRSYYAHQMQQAIGLALVGERYNDVY